MKMYIIIEDKTTKTDEFCQEEEYDKMREVFLRLLEEQILPLYKKREHTWRHITDEYESIIVMIPNDKYFTEFGSTRKNISSVSQLYNKKSEETLRQIDNARKQGIIKQ